MEKRLVIATVLSFLVLIGYQLLVVKPKLQKQPQKIETTAAPPTTAAVTSPGIEVKRATEKKEEARQAVSVVKEALKPVSAEVEQEITIETSLFISKWSNRGGVLRSFVLKNHRNINGQGLDLVHQLSQEVDLAPFSIWLEDKETAGMLNNSLFMATGNSTMLKDGDKTELIFDYSDGKSTSARKVIRLTGGKYDLGVDVKIIKNEQSLKPFVIWGPSISNLSAEELKLRYSATSGIAIFSGGRVTRIDEKKYKPEQSSFNFVDWAAYEDNYFTALFVPAPHKGQAVFLRAEISPSDEAGQSGVASPPAYFIAVSDPVMAFVGPKEIDVLKNFGYQAKKIINFGAFGAIAEIFLAVVKFFYNYVRNWGLAIILMTVVIKIVFFPLTYSSTKSMARMAEIQPKIKAIRAKYKKSKTDIEQRRQMNEEMMKLYKEHGINPAGGCLPLLIQLPVFWGVFRMLVVSVELRHSPFIFWIKDLSVRDPYYVTPILMGITQFISQKMTPSTADPAQTRIMLMMPFIMTIFFMSFQSGLVLYWLTTNVLQIGQQAIMNKLMAAKKRDEHGKRTKK